MADRPKTNKRDLLLINYRVQIAVLLYSVFLALVVTVFNYVLNYLSNLDLISSVPQSTIALAVALFAALFFVVVAWMGLLLTNRIAGPIHHLQMHMQNAVDGKPVGELSFRNHDFFKEVLIPYNEMVRRVSQKT